MNIEFWIGIIFICITNTECGMITTTRTYGTKENCYQEVNDMLNKIRNDSKPLIIDGRCSKHTIFISEQDFSKSI